MLPPWALRHLWLCSHSHACILSELIPLFGGSLTPVDNYVVMLYWFQKKKLYLFCCRRSVSVVRSSPPAVITCRSVRHVDAHAATTKIVTFEISSVNPALLDQPHPQHQHQQHHHHHQQPHASYSDYPSGHTGQNSFLWGREYQY